MKAPADALVESILELPTPDQLVVLHRAVVDPDTGMDALDLFWSWVLGPSPQVAAAFLAHHVTLFAGSVCEADDCDQVGTHLDPGSRRDRLVCDGHGEHADEPWDEAS